MQVADARVLSGPGHAATRAIPHRSLVRVMLRSRERQESAAKQRLIADVERISREQHSPRPR